jgi:hypothetical protein
MQALKKFLLMLKQALRELAMSPVLAVLTLTYSWVENHPMRMEDEMMQPIYPTKPKRGKLPQKQNKYMSNKLKKETKYG